MLGFPGVRGLKGDDGPRGLTGDKGDKGIRGSFQFQNILIIMVLK